jgi:LmbE family N-acetylglucosaminyl deacetylase
MKLTRDTAEVFVPDGLAAEAALARTTHLAVGAHQDDLEVMAWEGISACFQREDRWFCGVVVTNGAGSPRDGLYRDYSDEQMRAVRMKEQRKAAVVGEYGAQLLLDHPSSAVKDPADPGPAADLEAILLAARPQVVYTHNLADKHDTHVAVTLRLLKALRALPADARPRRVLGCEVWRDLDWMCDGDKVCLDATHHDNLQMALLGVFDSQICGGKRYDLATMGRRRAQSTFFESHGVDTSEGQTFALDLTPLVEDPSLDPFDHVQGYIQRMSDEIRARIGKLA